MGPCRTWGSWITLREHSLLWLLFTCSSAGLSWWVELPSCSPCCLPLPPKAHGLLFLGPSPEQALPSHCSGLFEALVAVTLTSSGIWKLSLNKLLSPGTVPALHIPRNIFGGKLLHYSPWYWWSHKTFLSFSFPTFHISLWLPLMWSFGSTKINPLYLCTDENFVHRQTFYISKLPL